MLGAFYIALAAASLVVWWTDPQTVCYVASCASVPGIFGRSWYLWAPIYYLISACLVFYGKRSWSAKAIIFGGVVFHAGLLVYGWVMTHSICSLCLLFFALEASLAILYMLLPPERNKVGMSFAGLILACAGLLLIVNPAIPETKPAVAAAEVNSGVSQLATTVNHQAVDDRYLIAQKPDGAEKHLDLAVKPALLWSPLCDHCAEALSEASKIPPESRPYIVATFTSDQKAIERKMAECGLQGQEYYVVQRHPGKSQYIPTLLYYK